MANRKSRELTVPVCVQARGSVNEIQDVRDGRLRIKTMSPPTDGRANKDVARQLARAFAVPPSRVTLKSGATRRNKTYLVTEPVTLPDWLESL